MKTINYNLNKTNHLVSKIIEELFFGLLAAGFLFYILEGIKAGLVTNLINLDLWLLLTVVGGGILIMTRYKKNSQPAVFEKNRYDLVVSFTVGVVSFAVAYYKAADLGWGLATSLSALAALVSTYFVYFLLSRGSKIV